MTTSFSIAGLIRRAAFRLKDRRDRRVLSALDDHILKDIGIHRSEIESVLRHRDRHIAARR
jgi:uncharacterized protein YjiS (DUF1127 family)